MRRRQKKNNERLIKNQSINRSIGQRRHFGIIIIIIIINKVLCGSGAIYRSRNKRGLFIFLFHSIGGTRAEQYSLADRADADKRRNKD